jgi:hypothetical protein
MRVTPKGSTGVALPVCCSSCARRATSPAHHACMHTDDTSACSDRMLLSPFMGTGPGAGGCSAGAARVTKGSRDRQHAATCLQARLLSAMLEGHQGMRNELVLSAHRWGR